MAEVEKLLVAKHYCEKLANGIDPISDKPVPSDSILNQVRLARLFFFLRDYINEELNNKPSSNRSVEKKASFEITRESLSKVEVSTNPISISAFSRRVSQNTEPTSRLFSHKWATDWLLKAGFLALSEKDGKKHPTQAGINIGISDDIRSNGYQEYRVVLYNKEAQQFLIDNIDSILEPQGYSVLMD